MLELSIFLDFQLVIAKNLKIIKVSFMIYYFSGLKNSLKNGDKIIKFTRIAFMIPNEIGDTD